MKQLSGDIDVYTSKFKPLKNALSGRDEKTLMKIIVHSDTDEVSLSAKSFYKFHDLLWACNQAINTKSA